MDSKLEVETNEQPCEQQKQSSVVSLGELPPEMLNYVSSFLSKADQARFSGVNHRVRAQTNKSKKPITPDNKINFDKEPYFLIPLAIVSLIILVSGILLYLYMPLSLTAWAWGSVLDLFLMGICFFAFGRLINADSEHESSGFISFELSCLLSAAPFICFVTLLHMLFDGPPMMLLSGLAFNAFFVVLVVARQSYLFYSKRRHEAYEHLLDSISADPTLLTTAQLEAFDWSSRQKESIDCAIYRYYGNQTANKSIWRSLLLSYYYSYSYPFGRKIPFHRLIRQYQTILEDGRKKEISTTEEAKSEEKGLDNLRRYRRNQDKQPLLADEKSSTDCMGVASNANGLFYRKTKPAKEPGYGSFADSEDNFAA